MNDDEMLTAMRSSLTGAKESLTNVHLDRSADAIRARARGRRLRRGLTGVGAGGTALGVGLALAVGGGPGTVGGGSGTNTRSVHVNLDAWSVNTVAGGLVYVDVRELREPVLLRQALARAGVPAIVTFGKVCTGASGADIGNLQRVLGKSVTGGEPKLTINPAAIPAGSELSIGIVSVSKNGIRGLDSSFGLVKKGSRLTCSIPRTPPGPGKTRTPHPEPSAGGTKGPGVPVGTGTAKG